MKLLEHKNLLIERAPNHRVAAQVPFYEEPVLCALHNRSDDEEGEGIFVTEYAPQVVLAVDWDPEDAWLKLVGKYNNREGSAALKACYKGPKDFVKQVGPLEDAKKASTEGKPKVARKKKHVEPAQAAA